MWQQRVWEAGKSGGSVEAVLAECVVLICRHLRDRGHVAGVPDATEAVRLACDLARLRGQAAPGRQELLEGLQTALAQGEVLGRGRALAKAMEEVLVGWRRGFLAPGTPRSGLGPALEEQLRKLNLPVGRMREPVESKLDPSRSALDRARHVTLHRMVACGIPYATLQAGEAIGMGETLTFGWMLEWTPATDASLALAGLRGVTLEQAAEGILRVREREVREAEGWGPDALLKQLHEAAQCGLVELVQEYLRELIGPFVAIADLAQCIMAIRLLQQLSHGHIPGLQPTPGEHPALALPAFELPDDVTSAPFLAAALRALPGVAGSDDPMDARALLELVGLFQTGSMGFGPAEEMPGQGGLWWQLRQIAEDGAPLMQGAAAAALVVLGQEASEWFGERLGSWLDAAVEQASRRVLSKRLSGALAAAGPMFEADPRCLEQLVERIHSLHDTAFLERLQALRSGFNVLSPAARGRLMLELEPHLPHGMDATDLQRGLTLSTDPRLLGLFAHADRLGQGAVDALAEVFHVKHEPSAEAGVEAPHARLAADPSHTLSPVDRWRLILGRERERLSQGGARAARALEELYGRGGGEGSGQPLFGPGAGGGQEDAFPTAREWGEELEALFGTGVREEVLAQAAVQGLTAAVMELNPEEVTPSVELLEQVLSLKGGMPESQLAHLRKLVARIVEQLVKELATRVRPALTGLTTPRPTRRQGGPLDLRRTVRNNLRHTRFNSEALAMIVPEELHFKTRAKRSMDWRVILVVDVSGSMEASIIYSAMMAAIINSLPAVSVNFITFNTQVIDLSHRVDDPLALLLEVSVGGGTHIARALKYARGMMKQPSRTIVAVVSDFEEGFAVEGLLAEVRALKESGAKLLGLAALDDSGKARYHKQIASQVAAAGMPVAALSPMELARWVGEQIRG
jgi:Mg-chelatase subunit ChlD